MGLTYGMYEVLWNVYKLISTKLNKLVLLKTYTKLILHMFEKILQKWSRIGWTADMCVVLLKVYKLTLLKLFKLVLLKKYIKLIMRMFEI